MAKQGASAGASNLRARLPVHREAPRGAEVTANLAVRQMRWEPGRAKAAKSRSTQLAATVCVLAGRGTCRRVH